MMQGVLQRKKGAMSEIEHHVDDELLTVAQSAKLVGLTRAGFYQSVASGRLPRPVYPSPRAPRWWRSRLLAAVNATEQSPAEARAARRAARLAAQT
jgi:predicted DNA-binding transcriptional regulator AlpA